MTTGAQQGNELSGEGALRGRGGVIIEKPGFIGSLNSFRSLRREALRRRCRGRRTECKQVEALLKAHGNIKFIYTIPTFQNPSGTTMGVEKRKALLALAKSTTYLF